ncbi:MAG: SHOCT domain-containing protein [Synergistaceae bacterium]
MAELFLIILVIAFLLYFTISRSIENTKKCEENISKAKTSLQKSGFVVSKQVTDTSIKHSLLVDEVNEKWTVVNAENSEYRLYNYTDLIEYQIFENGNTLIKGTTGDAVVGGLLFGVVGAIAGASSSKEIKDTCDEMTLYITVNDLQKSQIKIELITTETKRGSCFYSGGVSKAKEFASVLSIIKTRAEEKRGQYLRNSQSYKPELCASDEIEKWYNLKEKGIITENEFIEKKKELLKK